MLIESISGQLGSNKDVNHSKNLDKNIDNHKQRTMLSVEPTVAGEVIPGSRVQDYPDYQGYLSVISGSSAPPG